MDGLRQNGLNQFKQGLATGGRGSQTVAPQGKTTPFSPPAAKTARPPGVSIRLPDGASRGMFRPGNMIHGQVAGQKGGQFLLRMGDQMLKADARVPLKVGDAVSFQVQGENKGQIHLKLLSSPMTKMSMADLSHTLTSMKVPMDSASMNLAKTMVELKIPLTKENFQQMKQVLAQSGGTAGPGGNQQAAPITTRVAASSFLQNAQLPVTPQNVTVLSNFLANNPQIGMQMVSMNTELKKLNENTNLSSEMTKIIADGKDLVGKMMLEPPKRNSGKGKGKSLNAMGLQGMAKQTGIETNMGPAGMSGGDDWDFPKMMRQMRERFAKEGLGGDELMGLMKGLEENLEAQKLINMAKNESNLGYYYLQIPMDPHSGELWLEYQENSDGQRIVDPSDARIEFLVNTESMGELHFLVDIRNRQAHIQLGTASEEVRAFAAGFLPALAERVAALGFERGRMRSVFRAHTGKRELVEHTDFDELERCNVQA